MMDSSKVKNKIKKAVIFLIVFAVISNLVIIFKNNHDAAAAGNLLKGGAFETDLSTYWETWKTASVTGTAELYRSYDVPFGQGSYSAAIERKGAPGSRFDIGFVGKSANNFTVDLSKTYYFKYYAKASVASRVSMYLEDASNSAAITPISEQAVTTDWQQYGTFFTPGSTGSRQALLIFTLGDLADNATLYFDSFTLTEFNPILSTTEIKGYAGETGKILRFNDLSLLSEEDVEIELPYYDELTGQATNKRFHPEKIVGGKDVYLNMYSQTYPGVGRVYIRNYSAGQFNYNLLPKLSELYPTQPRANEDLVLKVGGLNPVPGASHIVVKSIDINGKPFESWLSPATFDSKLSLVNVKLPVGVMSGPVFMHTSYVNTAGTNIENRTAVLNYKVKPVIFSVAWSKRGFEQVGDNLRILGKGIANRPTVNFYSATGKLIAGKTAKVVAINAADEAIEVVAPTNANEGTLRVSVNGVESDDSQALNFLARPKLNNIVSKNKRTITETGGSLPAAMIGEEITLNGEGFFAASTSNISVEFQSYNYRFTAAVAPGKYDPNGKFVKVTVPANAKTGFLAVQADTQKSNYLPLEIIPKVTSITPDPIVPDELMTIHAQGVGGNINLLKVIFNLTNNEKIEAAAENLLTYDNDSVITLKVPLAISNRFSSVNLRYDRWTDNEKVYLNVRPFITGASINLDDKILTISGYGFSINPKENVITYHYADQARTVVTPSVKMLGVYPTEEGQEIRIQILDGYRYGYVSVKTGDYASNEANFGPVSVKKITRRVEFVPADGRVRGVLYITGYNFGSQGDVMVGAITANTHYRSEYFIIAVVDSQYVNNNPVIVTKR